VKSPRVSVVMPVHNGERFIEQSIRSVLDQTREVHECIVVDDGSTDGTLDTISDFGAQVHVLRQPRRGVAAARNAGIGATSGTHVAFLDADDVWMPEKTERQLDALATLEASVAAVCGFVIADENLRPLRCVVHRSAGRALKRALLIEAAGVGFSFTGVTTQTAIERVGGFDERLSVSADLEFAWRLARSGPIASVAAPLAMHRSHSCTQMHRDTGQLVHDMDLVIAAAEISGLPARAARRSRANLDVYAAFRLLRQGERSSGAVQLFRSAARHPATPVRLAARFAAQRARQNLDLRSTGLPGPTQRPLLAPTARGAS
jgi:glycosyltransferase involved in cell wall biosynthesis